MRRSAAIAATTVVALGAGAAALAVNGSAQSPGARTIELVNRNCSFKSVDVPPRGRGRMAPPGVGDSATLTCRLEDPTGARVGSLDSVGQFTVGGRNGRGVAIGIYKLRDGEIHVVTRLVLSDVSGSVVGGTGAYAGARGTFTSVDRPGDKGGDPSDNTITLLP
ncbi:MAG: hypothetical protein WKF42_09725 [Solirubrobacteraceae bacterium]